MAESDSHTGNLNISWFFSKEALASTPSRLCGINAEKELLYRKQSSNFISDMGEVLELTETCVSTAIVYMNRFYMYHSFTRFNRNTISSAALFLAAKVEEEFTELHEIIFGIQTCLYKSLDSKGFKSKWEKLISYENIIVQTLGFDFHVHHPHKFIDEFCRLVNPSLNLIQTAQFIASVSLHLTTMCLTLKPTVVACICINVASKWADCELPNCSDGKEWFECIDDSINPDQLDELSAELMNVYFNNCSDGLKSKIMCVAGLKNRYVCVPPSSTPRRFGDDESQNESLKKKKKKKHKRKENVEQHKNKREHKKKEKHFRSLSSSLIFKTFINSPKTET